MNILNIFLENKDAILAIPQELKLIFLGLLALSIVIGLIRGLFKIVKIAAIAAVIYFVLAFFGVF